jgi:alpha-tubulin suppressor-like RCC1 family protein
VVKALAGKKVLCAAAGALHTVALTEGGVVYTFGYGQDRLVPFSVFFAFEDWACAEGGEGTTVVVVV